MKVTRKIALTVLVLAISGCSTGDLNSGIKSNTFLAGNDFIELEKEYSQFKTKSFSQSYLDKKLNQWLATTNNEKLLRELKFAEIKHPNLAHVFFAANTAKHNTMLGKANIIAQMNIDNPFAIFMGLNPVSTSITYAGNGISGFTDSNGTNSQLASPAGLTTDSAGNIYVADFGNNKIRKIDTAGNVTTVASGFSSPEGITIDNTGNLYVAEYGGAKIKKVDTSGNVTTVAGSSSGYLDANGTNAMFSGPTGLTISGGNIYVCEYSSSKVRKIDTAGNVTTVAGSSSGYLDANGTNARFDHPEGITSDSAGNIYVADSFNNKIRKIDTAGNVTTVAGSSAGYLDANGTNSQFTYPIGMVFDSTGNLFIADYQGNKIRKMDTAGNVTTIAGSSSGYTEGTGTNARFQNPLGITINSTGSIFVSEYSGHRIRKLSF